MGDPLGEIYNPLFKGEIGSASRKYTTAHARNIKQTGYANAVNNFETWRKGSEKLSYEYIQHFKSSLEVCQQKAKTLQDLFTEGGMKKSPDEVQTALRVDAFVSCDQVMVKYINICMRRGLLDVDKVVSILDKITTTYYDIHAFLLQTIHPEAFEAVTKGPGGFTLALDAQRKIAPSLSQLRVGIEDAPIKNSGFDLAALPEGKRYV